MRKFDMGARRLSARAVRSYAAAAVPKMFATRAATESGGTEILLYDEIGWYGITAKAFVSALATIGDGPLTVRICSPGGDAFEGMAIYNALRYRAQPVSIVIDGIAASAASIVAMAGSISMREQSELMIHNCWGFCVGNRHDMLETAAIQERLDGQMAQIYAEKSGASAAVMAAAMDAETYYTIRPRQPFGCCLMPRRRVRSPRGFGA
jgi:ATP-dependent Clp protease, protease subunit